MTDGFNGYRLCKGLGCSSIAVKLAEDFTYSLPGSLAHLHSLWASRDLLSLAEGLHSLAGSFAVISAPAMHQCALMLESKVIDGSACEADLLEFQSLSIGLLNDLIKFVADQSSRP